MRAAAYPALQKTAFLCIDDHEDLLECEKSFLESFGYGSDSCKRRQGTGTGFRLPG